MIDTQSSVRDSLLGYRLLLGGLILVVLFVPMRRYALPIQLPFNLEPYRIFVSIIAGFWFLSLLSDPRVRVRASGLEAPLGLFVLAILASLATNPGRFATHQSEALKTVTLLLSLVVVFYLGISILRRKRDIHQMVEIIALGGAVVALLAAVEARTGWTPFTHLERFVPVLRPLGGDELLVRGGKFRAFGPAEHPIALGALLAIITPLSFAVALRRSGLWWLTTLALVIGAVSTVSRTAVLMLLTAAVVVLAARWVEVRRYAVILFLPAVAMIHFAVPGTLGSLRSAFQPQGGLIAEQSTLADSRSSAGRVADIAPTLDQVADKPLFGHGVGTRIVTGPNPESRLLDNQWLGSLVDTGIVGTFALTWLFALFITRMLSLSRHTPGVDGYLPLGFAAAAAAFAVGMFTYDALAFTQVTFVMFFFFALGSVIWREQEHPVLARASIGAPDTGSLHMAESPAG